MRPSFDLSLYLVTDSGLTRGRALEDIVAAAAKGGVTIVQLREKEMATGEFIELARRLKSLLSPLNIPLIINDRIDVALASNADGVHIGQSDMSYQDARKILGNNKIIGLSVESAEEVLEANKLDVDYIGISPLHATPTKTDTHQPFGVEGCTRAVNQTIHPSVAIGGINLGNVAQTMECGVDGVAVVSAIVSADDPEEASRQLKEAINKSRPKWSEKARRASEAQFKAILEQPFNQEMMKGTLSKERFERYLKQDIIYIRNYSEEMVILSNMLPEGEPRKLFQEFAIEGMEAEKSLHALLSSSFDISGEDSCSLTTQQYIDHTRQYIDRGDKALSIAAILPCIWIYNLVGEHLYRNSQLDGNPYRDWIETYSSDMMYQGVKLSIEISDSIAENSSQSTQAKMKQAFVKAVWFEWAFWEYGYHGQDKI